MYIHLYYGHFLSMSGCRSGRVTDFKKFFCCFFIHVVLAVLGLCCCRWTFSSFSDWGLLSSSCIQASPCDGFSCCGAQALGHTGFSTYNT